MSIVTRYDSFIEITKSQISFRCNGVENVFWIGKTFTFLEDLKCNIENGKDFELTFDENKRVYRFGIYVYFNFNNDFVEAVTYNIVLNTIDSFLKKYSNNEPIDDDTYADLGHLYIFGNEDASTKDTKDDKLALSPLFYDVVGALAATTCFYVGFISFIYFTCGEVIKYVD
jgi:hypothetical protein